MHKLQQQYQEQIQELVDACVRVAELGVTSHGGNLSYRVDGSVVLITPTKVAKRKIKFDDVCIIDMDGNVLFAKEGGNRLARPHFICGFSKSALMSKESSMLIRRS